MTPVGEGVAARVARGVSVGVVGRTMTPVGAGVAAAVACTGTTLDL